MSQPLVRRQITPEKEAGLEPVGWSWEQDGGMLNCFPYPPNWSYDQLEKNAYWIGRGFTVPRPLFFQTPLQKAAPALLEALKKAQEDINWMLNSGQFLNSHVFEYLDAAIAKAGDE